MGAQEKSQDVERGASSESGRPTVLVSPATPVGPPPANMTTPTANGSPGPTANGSPPVTVLVQGSAEDGRPASLQQGQQPQQQGLQQQQQGLQQQQGQGLQLQQAQSNGTLASPITNPDDLALLAKLDAANR